jgi:hypothetical protein
MKKALLLVVASLFLLSCGVFPSVSEVLGNLSDAAKDSADEPAQSYQMPTDIPAPTATPRPSITEPTFCAAIEESTAKCTTPQDTFGRYDKIYFVFHISKYPDNTSFRAEWFYDSGKAITNYELTTYGSRYVYFFMTPGTSWKESGGYLNLYVDGNLYSTYYFDIR